MCSGCWPDRPSDECRLHRLAAKLLDSTLEEPPRGGDVPAATVPPLPAEVERLCKMLEQRARMACQFALAADDPGEETDCRNDAALLDNAAALLRRLAADAERLDWLEETANGHPVEVDSFTQLREPAHDRVFLTQYPCDPNDARMCDLPDCKHHMICRHVSERVGEGRTLRAAIDAARRGKEDA